MTRRADIALSLVVPMFAVEQYLPAFLSSLELQRPGGYVLEVVFVDDGSPDECAMLVDRWRDRLPWAKIVLTRQGNAGVSAARNAGLALASGEWVSFPDPDDELDSDYLRQMARFLTAHPSIDAATASILHIDERRARVRDIHPLRERFARGSRVVDLSDEPDVFLMNAATAFFRRTAIASAGVEFRRGLHASEDALFVADFLLRTGRSPRLGVVAEAQYLYRKRVAGTSAVDGYRRQPATYIDRFRDGYLPLLERAALSGGAPGWLQRQLIYEYKWLFEAQTRGATYAGALTDEQRAEVLVVTRDCLQFVDTETIGSYQATPLSLQLRMLLRVLKGDTVQISGPYGVRQRPDAIEYRWMSGADVRGPLGSESARRRVPDYFGQQDLVEWVQWRPSSPIDAAATMLPDGTPLSRWSPRTAARRSASWRARTAVRQARATWASRIALLRLAACFGPRNRWALDPAIADLTRAAFEQQARLRGYTVVSLPAGPRGTAAPSTRYVLTMLRATVIITSAERAEALASSRPTGARRRWLSIALIDTAPDRLAATSLEYAAVDLIATTNRGLANVITAEGSALGYSPSDVVVARASDLVEEIERRLQSPRRDRSTRP